MHITSEKIIRSANASITRRGDGDNAYLMGNVLTVDGIVRVFSQGAAVGRGMARLDDHSSYTMVLRGRVFHWRERKTRTERGLTIMAGKFAKRVAGR